MLERIVLAETHAIAILLKDHDRVKALFDRFEEAATSPRKESVIAQVAELKIHAAIEEEIFYPTVRQHVGKDLMNEADEEHHVARVLIAELDHDGPDDDRRMAKFTVLAALREKHRKHDVARLLVHDQAVRGRMAEQNSRAVGTAATDGRRGD